MNFLYACNEMLRISFEGGSLYELWPSTCCEMKTHRAQSPRVSLCVRFEGMFLPRRSLVLEEEGGQAMLLRLGGVNFFSTSWPGDPAPLEIHRPCLYPPSVRGEPAEAVAGGN